MTEKNKDRSFDDYMKSINENIEKIIEIQKATAEETKQRQAEYDRKRAEDAEEAKQRQAEYERKRAADADEYERKRAADAEESKKRQEEYERKRAADAEESKKRQEEYERKRTEAASESKKRQEEHEQWRVEFDRDMKKLQEFWGDFSNNIGSITEQYFYNSFKAGQSNFFGEKFDSMEKKVKTINKVYRDEYDIVLINGVSIAIIEVKHKAHKNDIPKILRKVETFRKNFPEYEKHKIYLGFASYSFYPEVEEECINHGIAIIQQSGDTMIMNEENIKTY